MAAVTIAAMTPADVDRLMPYEQALFGPDNWTADAYRDELRDTATRHYVVAEDADGALVGWAGVMVAADQADILTVGVIPSARRQGIARHLLAALDAEARRRGAREMFLDVRVDNEAARALYRAEGYTEVGRRPGYYEGRIDAVVMWREL